MLRMSSQIRWILFYVGGSWGYYSWTIFYVLFFVNLKKKFTVLALALMIGYIQLELLENAPSTCGGSLC